MKSKMKGKQTRPLSVAVLLSVLTVRKTAKADGPDGGSDADAAGGGPPAPGCKADMVGDHYIVQGDCYTSFPWDENVSVELHGSVWASPASPFTHLTDGRARIFNLGNQTTLIQIMVDNNPHEMVVTPQGTVEIAYGSDANGDFASVFSDLGNTEVGLDYESQPVQIPCGQGQKFYFRNSAGHMACSARSSAAGRNERSAPSSEGGLVTYLLIVVLIIVRRKTFKRAPARATVRP